MRALQRHPLARLLLVSLLAAVPTSAVWRGNSGASVVLFAVLTLLGYAALSVAPDAIAFQRRHYWRWWRRSSAVQGPFWPGTRLPRGPGRRK